jgi:hypothetical protein
MVLVLSNMYLESKRTPKYYPVCHRKFHRKVFDVKGSCKATVEKSL